MTEQEKEERFWYLTRGTEWISVHLDKDRKVYIHNFKLGHIFDTMGFGDVITSEEVLLDKIREYIENDCKMEDEYKRRVEVINRFEI